MSDYITSDGQEITDYDAHEQFNEMLNECYDVIKFGEMTYMPADVLKACDPIAYRCMFNDYADSEGGEEN